MHVYYTICDLSSPRVVWKLSFTVTWSGAQGRWAAWKNAMSIGHFHLLADNFHLFPPKNEQNKHNKHNNKSIQTSMKLVTSSNQKRGFSQNRRHGSIFPSLFSGHWHSELQQSPWPVEKCRFRCGICSDTFSTTGLQDMWPQCGMNDVFFFFLRHTPRGSRCWLNNLWGQQTVWWSPFVWCTVRCNRYLLCEDKNTSVLVSYSYHHVFAQPLVFSPRCRTQLSCHLCNIQEVRDALQKFGQLVREDSRWKNQLGACFIKLFDMDEE